MDRVERTTGGLLGVAIGDALGLPAEGKSRPSLRRRPIEDMRGSSVGGIPAGTWSDDTSLTLCLADTLCAGFSPQRCADTFLQWFEDGLWTPFGQAFGIGRTTHNAMRPLQQCVPPLEAV